MASDGGGVIRDLRSRFWSGLHAKEMYRSGDFGKVTKREKEEQISGETTNRHNKEDSMKIVTVNQAKNEIEQLVSQANDDHQPILLSGTEGNAVLIAEADWNSIQETLYLQSIPGMAESILEGGNTPIEDCVDEESIRAILNG